MPIYQAENESLDEWAHRAFVYSNANNPALTIKDLEPLSGWIFTEGLIESSLRQAVRSAKCAGLKEAVAMARKLTGGRRVRFERDDDSWSTEGVVGVVSFKRRPLEQDEEDKWSTVATLGVASSRK